MVNLAINKTKTVLMALIVIAGAFTFLVGQEALGQEVVVTEIRMTVDPSGIPVSDVDVSFDAETHRARVYKGAIEREYYIKETSGDNIADAEVSFRNKMRIYNATEGVVFDRTIVFERGLDRTIKVYVPSKYFEPGTEMKIIIDIEMEITFLTGKSITRDFHKDFFVPVNSKTQGFHEDFVGPAEAHASSPKP